MMDYKRMAFLLRQKEKIDDENEEFEELEFFGGLKLKSIAEIKIEMRELNDLDDESILKLKKYNYHLSKNELWKADEVIWNLILTKNGMMELKKEYNYRIKYLRGIFRTEKDDEDLIKFKQLYEKTIKKARENDGNE